MRTGIKITFIVTGIFTLLNLLLDVSFKVDLMDKIVFIVFFISGLILIILEIPKIWMKLVIAITILALSYSFYFLGEIFGYESRIVYIWTLDEYNIELEHRLEIAGPGCYWFLVNKDILGGTLEKRIESRQYQARLPNPPETFEFNTSSDSKISILCCDTSLLQNFSFDKIINND